MEIMTEQTKDKNLLTLEQKICFKEDDFDAKGNVKASALMYAFQEIAAAHAESLGLGFDDLIVNNYIWVLTKLRFEIKQQPVSNREYILRTYPRPRKGVTFFRDYYIYDGDVLMAVGTSQWCIINFETRRIERAKIDFDGQFIDHEPFENGIEKFKVNQDALVKFGVHKVVEDDLDDNEHVNNCRYAVMVEDELSGRGECSIYFSKEALLGDEIILYKNNEDGYDMIEGKLEDGTIIFQVKTK